MENNKENTGVIFGFWVYLMTDLLMFGVLFAAYAVLRDSTYGGITIKEIFDPPYVLAETLILLTSSFTCALGTLAALSKNKRNTVFFFLITLFLGVCFLAMELNEFRNMFAEGNTFQKRAFLSSYFTLVGTHGLHILTGSFWILLLVIQ